MTDEDRKWLNEYHRWKMVDIIRYFESGKKLSTKLISAAISAKFSEEYPEELAEFYAGIMRDSDELEDVARRCEIAVWFGRKDLATADEVKRSHEYSQSIECFRGTGDFGLTPGEHSLQAYYRGSDARGHESVHPDFKAMLWGCAGRALLTIEGRVAGQSEDDDVPSITLIFDETAVHPRGGIQSMSGTKPELIDLLAKATVWLDGTTFRPNEHVTIGG